MEGLDAALRQPAVVRARNSADSVLEEAQAVGELSMPRAGGENKAAHDHVRVAVDVLGDAVHDKIGAEQEGGLVEGGEEGVVDEDNGIRGMSMSDRCNTGDVYEAEGGVGGRFNPDELAGRQLRHG